RDWVGIEDGQSLQRAQEDVCCVQTSLFIRAMGSGDELGLGTSPDIRLKNSVRVVEIRNNDGETGEVFLERLIQISNSGEEAGQWTGFDGADLIGQTTSQRQFGDAGVAQQFEPGLWKLPPQRREHRQRENEIADCPATDHQNSPLRSVHSKWRPAG